MVQPLAPSAASAPRVGADAAASCAAPAAAEPVKNEAAMVTLPARGGSGATADGRPRQQRQSARQCAGVQDPAPPSPAISASVAGDRSQTDGDDTDTAAAPIADDKAKSDNATAQDATPPSPGMSATVVGDRSRAGEDDTDTTAALIADDTTKSDDPKAPAAPPAFIELQRRLGIAKRSAKLTAEKEHVAAAEREKAAVAAATARTARKIAQAKLAAEKERAAVAEREKAAVAEAAARGIAQAKLAAEKKRAAAAAGEKAAAAESVARDQAKLAAEKERAAAAEREKVAAAEAEARESAQAKLAPIADDTTQSDDPKAPAAQSACYDAAGTHALGDAVTVVGGDGRRSHEGIVRFVGATRFAPARVGSARCALAVTSEW